MEKIKSCFLHFFLVFCLAFTPDVDANVLETEEYWHEHVKEFDEYWQERAKDAEEVNKKAFDPNPYAVSGNLTLDVSELLVGPMKNRRNLKRLKKGPCMATNPIDRCWRCDPKWADNRKKLADCVQGFGRKTTGGKRGPYYVVTDSSDKDMINPKPGTLRHAVTRSGPLWIIFATSMSIRLNQELIMTSDKTVDARGANVHIAKGAGFTIQFIENVIICNLHIHDIKAGTGGLIIDSEQHFGFRTRSDGDGISIFGSSNIWIDHVSMRKCDDGLIDATVGSTAITISNSHFTKHNQVMLFGASDSFKGDEIMQITVAFNHFGKGLVQRMPRCRWGFVHVVNNDYTHWNMYAIGGSQHPTIISEGNRFIAPDSIHLKQVTMRHYTPESVWMNWQWRSINDEFINGAYFTESGPELDGRPFSRQVMISARPGTFVRRLTRYSGTLGCRAGKPC